MHPKHVALFGRDVRSHETGITSLSRKANRQARLNPGSRSQFEIQPRINANERESAGIQLREDRLRPRLGLVGRFPYVFFLFRSTFIRVNSRLNLGLPRTQIDPPLNPAGNVANESAIRRRPGLIQASSRSFSIASPFVSHEIPKATMAIASNQNTG